MIQGVTKMTLTLTREEANKFSSDNHDAMLLIHQATDEYISARCLLLNGLFPGLILAAQSVEKYIKGFILLVDRTKNLRSFSHNFNKLFDELKKISPHPLLNEGSYCS